MAEPPYDIARKQGGHLRTSDLVAAGCSSDAITTRVERGELVRLRSGLYRLSGVPNNWHQRIWEALLSAQSGAVVSHRTAARLHGLGGFRPDPVDILEVVDDVRRRPDPAASHASLILPPHHRTSIEGIPVTTVERTLFDLAGQASLKRRRRGLPFVNEHVVERVLDDALARGLPVSKVVAVLDEIGGRGRGGTALMRGLLDQRGPGYVATESELEDAVDEVLRASQLPPAVRQRNLGGFDELIGRVDLLIVEYKVVIEADGRRHHIALVDRERDSWRDLELTAAGFVVVRVTWRQIKREPRQFVRQLERVLRLRGWRPDTEAA